MKAVKVIIVVEIVWYAICAFISAQPDPFTWSIEARLLFTSVGILAAIAALTFPGVV